MTKQVLSIFSIIVIVNFNLKSQTVATQLDDCNFLYECIKLKEGRLDLNQSADTIEIVFERLKDSLSIIRTPMEQYKLFSSAVSKINCGHTQIHPSQSLRDEWLYAGASPPFDYFLIGKKLIVNRTMKSDRNNNVQLIPPGSEIISLNNQSLDEMMKDISPYFSSDENGIDFKYHQASYMFDFYRHLAKPYKTDSVEVRYSLKNEIFTKKVPVGNPPNNTINNRLKKIGITFSKQSNHMGRFKILDNEYGYFRFLTFENSGGKQYERFLESSFERLKDREIDKLIIDLRGNTGGNMQYVIMKYFLGKDALLGRYVVEKPYNKSDKSHFKKQANHKWLTKQQNKEIKKGIYNDGKVHTESVNRELIFDGKILVITNEGTFSAASMLACHLKELADAKILGAKAGGTFYAGNAGTLYNELPNSGFSFYINPNTFYSHLDMYHKESDIKNPDIEFSSSILNTKLRDQSYINAAKKALDEE